ncbi:MAG: SUF system NifU family Fe-S cluster assembly protein [Ignavibacteriales bacterium]|nr:SUF system NifU family Fe-S cluster assembly protein [Ignavibacteriales bacterium]
MSEDDGAIEELYRRAVIEHSRAPANFREIDDPTGVSEQANELCGDEVKVAVVVEGGAIQDAAFVSRGCALVKASGSIMTRAVSGQSVGDAKQLAKRFVDFINGDLDEFESPGETSALETVRRFPARRSCATLSWEALAEALANADENKE